MPRFVSGLILTGISEVELNAWFGFFDHAFDNVEVCFTTFNYEWTGATAKFSYALHGSTDAFKNGLPEVLHYASAFAASLAAQMSTDPHNYIVQIIYPIMQNAERALNAAGREGQEKPTATGVLNLKDLDFNRIYAWLFCMVSALKEINIILEIDDHPDQDGTMVVNYRLTGTSEFVLFRFQFFYKVMSCFSGAMAVLDDKPPREYFFQIMLPVLESCRQMYPELGSEDMSQESNDSTLSARPKSSREKIH